MVMAWVRDPTFKEKYVDMVSFVKHSTAMLRKVEWKTQQDRFACCLTAHCYSSFELLFCCLSSLNTSTFVAYGLRGFEVDEVTRSRLMKRLIVFVFCRTLGLTTEGGAPDSRH